ncbi:FtsK/SpoIIIE domain-containing protein [Streptomyces parvus]|uniref:FtsK/SpoIIIE domain-containing protein n=1 Tax=Streptomyces parvus TaxID=66428 RepID=UPI0033D57B03
MSKTKKSKAQAEEDMWGQAAGAIGVLVMVTGGLAAVKDKLGLSWPATIALCTGVLIALGYAAWWIKTTIKARWAREPATKATAAAEQASPAEGLEETVPAHTELTTTLRTAGVLSKDQIIRADQARVEQVNRGTRYDFLLPQGLVQSDFAKRLPNVAGTLGKSELHTRLERSADNERRVNVIVLDDPPFTHPFTPPTKEQIQAFDGIPFAHDIIGDLAGLKTFSRGSMLLSGMSQSGKTTFLQGLLTCLIIAYGEDGFDLYVIDGKLCGLTDFAKICKRHQASSSPATMESFIDMLQPIVDKRYAMNDKAKAERRPEPRHRPVFFVVDEVADFFRHDGSDKGKEQASRVTYKAAEFARKCLEAEVTAIWCTQRPEKTAVPVEVRAQFRHRMCLYVDSKGTAEVALGDSYFTTLNPIHPAHLNPSIPGQGVLYASGKSMLVRGISFPKEFIWEAIDAVEARQKQALAATPQTPAQKALDLFRAKGVDFIPTSVLAPEMDITDERASVAGQKLSKLLGVPAGKGEDNITRGYWARDLAAAAHAET